MISAVIFYIFLLATGWCSHNPKVLQNPGWKPLQCTIQYATVCFTWVESLNESVNKVNIPSNTAQVILDAVIANRWSVTIHGGQPQN